MWSGPRNISTAMMRSWENRLDCSVIDEPFYACYLQETGLEHPLREQILNTMPKNRKQVIKNLTAVDPGTKLQYQKHMTHHMPTQTDLSWCQSLRHCFLIRDPAEVIASYLEKMPSVSSNDIGIQRQAELFAEITEITGHTPLVLDSKDVLQHPEQMLRCLCNALDIPFEAHAMLHWPAGKRVSDGIWASHWYQSVEASTGFSTYSVRNISLKGNAAALAGQMQPFYAGMAAHRLRPK